MPATAFFQEQSDQSAAKGRIVSKYFSAWAKVLLSATAGKRGTIAYVDLFAGPGRYTDGSDSTPIYVLQQIIADDAMCQRMATVFNDGDHAQTKHLEQVIASLPGIERLSHPPIVHNIKVGEDMVALLQRDGRVPTLFFVDPFGYKGLSLRLIDAAVKNWGCDCVFFFNYNRVNMGVANDIVQPHMEALFGQDGLKILRNSVDAAANPNERELAVVEAICQALIGMGNTRYVLPFRFRNDAGTRTSHHLIFVSKHLRGYEIMKDIMAGESSDHDQGVASFEYSPASEQQAFLFALSRPLDDLLDMLLEDLSGRTVTRDEIYESHSVGTRYVKKNYNEALKQLETANKIVVVRPPRSRSGTYGENTTITFP